jgi:hypothetical protein
MPRHEITPPTPKTDASEPEARIFTGPSFSFGPSVIGLMKAIFVLGSSLTPAGAAQQQDMRLVQTLVRTLCEAEPPVTNWEMGESHLAPGNFNLIGRILEGAADAADAASSELHFYREFAVPVGRPDGVELERQMNKKSPKIPTMVADQLMVPLDKADDKTRFIHAALRPSVSLKLINYLDPNRRDMTRFFLDSALSFASVGLTHTLEKTLDSQHQVTTYVFLGNYTYDYKNNIYRNVYSIAEPYKGPGFTPEARQDMTDGFSRASEKALTVHIMSSSSWKDAFDGVVEPEGRALSPVERRERFIHHYNKEGFAVIEVPFAKGLNATMVVPAQFLTQLKSFQAERPDHVKLYCDGLPKCAPGAGAPPDTSLDRGL